MWAHRGVKLDGELLRPSIGVIGSHHSPRNGVRPHCMVSILAQRVTCETCTTSLNVQPETGRPPGTDDPHRGSELTDIARTRKRSMAGKWSDREPLSKPG